MCWGPPGWITTLWADIKGQRLFKDHRAVRRQRWTMRVVVCWAPPPVADVAMVGTLVLWSFQVSYSKSLVCLSGTNRSSQRWFSFFSSFFFSLYVCWGTQQGLPGHYIYKGPSHYWTDFSSA